MFQLLLILFRIIELTLKLYIWRLLVKIVFADARAHIHHPLLLARKGWSSGSESRVRTVQRIRPLTEAHARACARVHPLGLLLCGHR